MSNVIKKFNEGLISSSDINKLSNEDKNILFKYKANLIHNNYYNYDKVNYINADTKITITCPKHGDFKTLPSSHLRGTNCKKCSYEIMSKERIGINLNKDKNKIFINKFKKFNKKNNLDISILDNYNNDKTKIKVRCNIHNIEFKATPFELIRSITCKECNKNKRNFNAIKNDKSKIKKRKLEIKKKILDIKNNFFSYAEKIFSYKKMKYIVILYKGIYFYNTIKNFISNKSCPNILDYNHNIYKNKIDLIYKLYQDKNFNNYQVAFIQDKNLSEQEKQELFIMRANFINKSKYKYENTIYKNFKNKIEIECPIHGEFIIRAGSHLEGNGCSKCCHIVSNIENNLFKKLKKIFPNKEIIQSYKYNKKSRKEIDIYFPKYKFGIEINGNYWHSEIIYYKKGKETLNYFRNHFLNKFNECQNNGITLLQLYEDELIDKEKLIINMIKYRLGFSKYKNMARKLEVREISNELANKFYNIYHLQGKCKCKFSYALIDNKKIKAVMSFNGLTSNRGMKFDNTNFELVRYASSGNISGGASRLLSHFIKSQPNIKTITTYSDNRYSTGKLYEKLRFKFLNDIRQSYYYIYLKNVKKRYHKSTFKKSNMKKRFDNYNPKLTELENALNNDYYRLWDAGKKKYILIIK